MAKKILKVGYYWTKMETGCCDHVRKSPLNILTKPWPFVMWRIDVIGPIEPRASNGHCFILVAIDYFTKWVEAASYARVQNTYHHTPSHIITDNGTNLNNKMMIKLCVQFKIRYHNSMPYRLKTNGAIEMANKNIK
ncbi:putative protein K02A2.6, partial [Mucuna pruriens]